MVGGCFIANRKKQYVVTIIFCYCLVLSEANVGERIIIDDIPAGSSTELKIMIYKNITQSETFYVLTANYPSKYARPPRIMFHYVEFHIYPTYCCWVTTDSDAKLKAFDTLGFLNITGVVDHEVGGTVIGEADGGDFNFTNELCSGDYQVQLIKDDSSQGHGAFNLTFVCDISTTTSTTISATTPTFSNTVPRAVGGTTRAEPNQYQLAMVLGAIAGTVVTLLLLSIVVVYVVRMNKKVKELEHASISSGSETKLPLQVDEGPVLTGDYFVYPSTDKSPTSVAPSPPANAV